MPYLIMQFWYFDIGKKCWDQVRIPQGNAQLDNLPSNKKSPIFLKSAIHWYFYVPF